MCLSNVNAVINIWSAEDKKINYGKPIQNIITDSTNTINNIAIVVEINVSESNDNDRTLYNVLNQNGVLECRLRMVKRIDDDNILELVLDQFNLNFGDNTDLKIEENRGRRFCNYRRIVFINSIVLPPDNKDGIFNVELIVNRVINEENIDANKGDIIQTSYNIGVS